VGHSSVKNLGQLLTEINTLIGKGFFFMGMSLDF
jgi:hypothetical protein